MGSEGKGKLGKGRDREREGRSLPYLRKNRSRAPNVYSHNDYIQDEVA